MRTSSGADAWEHRPFDQIRKIEISVLLSY